MPIVTVHRPRPVLLVVPSRGEELRAATAEALAGRAVGHAWIVGRGTLDEVELEESGARRTFATPTRIVSLEGRATAGQGGGVLSLSATVARKTPQGVELLTGDLVRAVAHEVELMITPLDPIATDAASEREMENESDAPHEAVVTPPAPAANDPWAAVAKASASAPSAGAVRARVVPPPPAALAPPAAPPTPPRRKTVDDEIYPEPGDLLDHFAFGRCIVLRSDGDELLVQHPASGRTRTIRLSALQASGPVDDDGKRLFKLTQRRSS